MSDTKLANMYHASSFLSRAALHLDRCSACSCAVTGAAIIPLGSAAMALTSAML